MAKSLLSKLRGQKIKIGRDLKLKRGTGMMKEVVSQMINWAY